MNGHAKLSDWVLGFIGGTIGGALGYYVFFLMTRQGFYAMVLPGALVGLGWGLLSGTKSNLMGVISGLLAVLLGIFIEWQFAPFVQDRSLAYFILHVGNLKSATLVMIALGGLFGFWFGKGREGRTWIRRSNRDQPD